MLKMDTILAKISSLDKDQLGTLSKVLKDFKDTRAGPLVHKVSKDSWTKIILKLYDPTNFWDVLALLHTCKYIYSVSQQDILWFKLAKKALDELPKRMELFKTIPKDNPDVCLAQYLKDQYFLTNKEVFEFANHLYQISWNSNIMDAPNSLVNSTRWLTQSAKSYLNVYESRWALVRHIGKNLEKTLLFMFAMFRTFFKKEIWGLMSKKLCRILGRTRGYCINMGNYKEHMKKCLQTSNVLDPKNPKRLKKTLRTVTAMFPKPKCTKCEWFKAFEKNKEAVALIKDMGKFKKIVGCTQKHQPNYVTLSKAIAKFKSMILRLNNRYFGSGYSLWRAKRLLK